MTTVGWKKDMVEKNVLFLLISCWMSDNLLEPCIRLWVRLRYLVDLLWYRHT